MEQIWGQNLNDKPAGSSRTALCHILLLCNYMISLWICNRRHWECRLTCWWLGKVFMAYSNWLTVELSRLMGIASARSRVVRLNTHAVATRWMCREVGWLCIPPSTSYRKQQSESCVFQAKKNWLLLGQSREGWISPPTIRVSCLPISRFTETPSVKDSDGTGNLPHIISV